MNALLFSIIDKIFIQYATHLLTYVDLSRSEWLTNRPMLKIFHEVKKRFGKRFWSL